MMQKKVCSPGRMCFDCPYADCITNARYYPRTKEETNMLAAIKPHAKKKGRIVQDATGPKEVALSVELTKTIVARTGGFCEWQSM